MCSKSFSWHKDKGQTEFSNWSWELCSFLKSQVHVDPHTILYSYWPLSKVFLCHCLGHVWTQLHLLLASWAPAKYLRQKEVSPSSKSPVLISTQHWTLGKHLSNGKKLSLFLRQIWLSVSFPTQYLKECPLTSAQCSPTLFVVLDL